MIFAICCFTYKMVHHHEYKLELYYIEDIVKIELYKQYRCKCGKIKNHEYITTKYCNTVLEKMSILKQLKALGYIPKEELEADLIAPFDWIKEE